MAVSSIDANISGIVSYAFESADDLRRFLHVLEAGLDGNQLFNEDIKELADDIRALLERTS